MLFLENADSTMSSFLELGADGWGSVEKRRMVEVRTIDDVCAEYGIGRIDILKSDTQGYDLEVFRGAQQAFNRNMIGMVYCEINFSDLYIGQPRFEEVCSFLRTQGFQLAALYTMHFHSRFVGWTDALFVNREYYRSVK